MIIPKTALCAWHVSFSAETLLVGDQYRAGYLITKDYYLEDSIGTSPSLSNVWKWTLNKTESSSVILCAWYDLTENVLLINTRTFSNYRHHHRHYNPPPPPHHHQQQRGLEPVQNKDHFQQKMMYVSARCCWIPPPCPPIQWSGRHSTVLAWLRLRHACLRTGPAVGSVAFVRSVPSDPWLRVSVEVTNFCLNFQYTPVIIRGWSWFRICMDLGSLSYYLECSPKVISPGTSTNSSITSCFCVFDNSSLIVYFSLLFFVQINLCSCIKLTHTQSQTDSCLFIFN